MRSTVRRRSALFLPRTRRAPADAATAAAGGPKGAPERAVSVVGRPAGPGDKQVVTIRVGGEEYGIDVHATQEIVMAGAVTRVPETPDFVDGLLSLRGQLVAVIDLRARLGLPRQAHTAASRIVVVRMGDEAVGLAVDSVIDVAHLSTADLRPLPALLEGASAEFVTGMAELDGRLIVLLDLDRVLSHEERERLGAVAASPMVGASAAGSADKSAGAAGDPS